MSTPPDERLEQEWIARSQHGDRAAFNELVVAYQQTVYALAYRMLGDEQAAADVAQEAFFAAYRHIGTFRGQSFRAWLLRIVSNAAIDAWRNRQRRPTLSIEQLAADNTASAADALAMLADPTGAVNPEESVLQHELQDLIQRGLAILPPDQRLAVILRDMQGLSYEEIAAITEVNLGTVKSRIARGRSGLRAFLRRHAELLPYPYRLKGRDNPG
jgi:RNA polymerase sigma-70 factor (ECF subfamily)